jgi:O-antigen ligase
VNKNHFAALMALALPMALALWATEMLPVVNDRGESLREHPRNADARLAMRILFSVLVVILLLALLFSRSRAGIGAGLAAFALASLAMVWNAGSLKAQAVLIVVALLAAMLGAYIGLTPVLERFAPDTFSLGYEGRAQLSLATLRAGLDFLPFGSGLGTFADVFPRYQAERLVGFIDHAHNDYAEAFLELGVAGVAVVVLFAAAYLLRWRELARGRLSRSLGFLQIAAGLGMLAMIVHGLFDFNFHIPANAIYFSFLAGVFFYTAEPSA